jgi:hypothetical protein
MKERFALLRVILLLALIGALPWGAESQAAETAIRQTEIVVAYNQYEWWLLRWSNNQVACQVYTDHDGLPTPNEVLYYCGNSLYSQWQNTRPCDAAASGVGSIASCSGFYLHLIGGQPLQRTLAVTLPEPRVWVTLVNCEPDPQNRFCPNIPSLLLTAEEPLPNETILAINGALDGEAFSCPGDTCEVPLKPTTKQGIEVLFWADSTYGDSSQQHTAQVRVLDTGLTGDPETTGWYVDILSSQYRGAEPAASCAASWGAFLPIGGPPAWLANPTQLDQLASSEPYVYLAGRLIASGAVSAAECPAGGLLENGWANACGLEKARQSVDAWQNRFDEQILQAAADTGVPTQLLKNVFAQESQFWPGMVRDEEYDEFGLGRLTELGADTVLLWNPTFYDQFCPLVLGADTCSNAYAHLDEADQAMLRGALVLSVNSECPGCQSGLDLTYIGLSIKLFAQTLQANCEQAGFIVHNTTQLSPGSAASYEDLWRFTLANYHAGPGCLTNALQTVNARREPMIWATVSQAFEPGCQTAVDFVEQITFSAAQVEAAPTPLPPPAIEAPVATATPTPLPTTTPAAYP